MSVRLRRRTKRGWSGFDRLIFRFLYDRHFCPPAEVAVPKFDAPPLRPLGSNHPDCSIDLPGVYADLVTALGFKPMVASEKSPGGFDSHPLPLAGFAPWCTRPQPPAPQGVVSFGGNPIATPCEAKRQIAAAHFAALLWSDRPQWVNSGPGGLNACARAG